MGRFLNADDTGVIVDNENQNENNLFFYCKNDCINMVDVFGYKPLYWINNQVAASDWSIISDKKTKISFNCYGFAINIYSGYVNLNPGFKSNKNNYYSYVGVNEIASRVKSDLKAMKRSGKIVSGANYKCSKKEYLIAMRVTGSNHKYDYHFMKKDSDGIWKFKGGWSNWVFELKSNLTPSNVSWDSYKKKSSILFWKDNKYVVKEKNVYTSKIIYMAVTK